MIMCALFLPPELAKLVAKKMRVKPPGISLFLGLKLQEDDDIILLLDYAKNGILEGVKRLLPKYRTMTRSVMLSGALSDDARILDYVYGERDKYPEYYPAEPRNYRCEIMIASSHCGNMDGLNWCFDNFCLKDLDYNGGYDAPGCYNLCVTVGESIIVKGNLKTFIRYCEYFPECFKNAGVRSMIIRLALEHRKIEMLDEYILRDSDSKHNVRDSHYLAELFVGRLHEFENIVKCYNLETKTQSIMQRLLEIGFKDSNLHQIEWCMSRMDNIEYWPSQWYNNRGFLDCCNSKDPKLSTLANLVLENWFDWLSTRGPILDASDKRTMVQILCWANNWTLFKKAISMFEVQAMYGGSYSAENCLAVMKFLEDDGGKCLSKLLPSPKDTHIIRTLISLYGFVIDATAVGGACAFRNYDLIRFYVDEITHSVANGCENIAWDYTTAHDLLDRYLVSFALHLDLKIWKYIDSTLVKTINKRIRPKFNLAQQMLRYTCESDDDVTLWCLKKCGADLRLDYCTNIFPLVIGSSISSEYPDYANANIRSIYYLVKNRKEEFENMAELPILIDELQNTI